MCVGSEQSGVLVRDVGQVLVDPGGETFEVFVARFQYSCADQDFAYVIGVTAGRQIVECGVGDGLFTTGEVGQHGRCAAFPQPNADTSGIACVSQAVDQGLQLARNRPVAVSESCGEMLPRKAPIAQAT